MTTTIATRPDVTGTFGVVASSHWLASQAAMNILEAGGNAFDAGVAAAFVLQVAEPHRAGVGGDVVASLYHAADNHTKVVCGQGPTPAAATVEAFQEMGLHTVPRTGLLAATVPGGFSALLSVQARWGTLPLRKVLEPAIALAHDGVPVTGTLRATLEANAGLFADHWRTSAASYELVGGWDSPQSRFTMPVLAETLRNVLKVAEAGSRGDREREIEAAHRAWYQGFVAESIGRFVAESAFLDSSGGTHSGLLEAQDLAEWSATIEEPVTATYADTQISVPGFWTQGPALLQVLGLVEHSIPNQLTDDAHWLHTLIEALKLAQADRLTWFGDPGAIEVPGAGLLESSYLTSRRELINPNKANFLLRPGAVDGRTGPIPAPLDEPLQAAPGRIFADPVQLPPGDGLAVTVTDNAGNMIAINCGGGTIQGSPAVPTLGFALGTRTAAMRLTAGLASSVLPSARPLTPFIPLVVRRGGSAWLASACSGADHHLSTQALTLVRLIHATADRPLQHGVDAPTLTVLHGPNASNPAGDRLGRVLLENTFDDHVIDGLRSLEHNVVQSRVWTHGGAYVVAKEGVDLHAAADGRTGNGVSLGR